MLLMICLYWASTAYLQFFIFLCFFIFADAADAFITKDKIVLI